MGFHNGFGNISSELDFLKRISIHKYRIGNNQKWVSTMDLETSAQNWISSKDFHSQVQNW